MITPLRPDPQQPRAPLANDCAEQALLGAVLVDNRALRQVSDFLRVEHFDTAVHGRIYDAIAQLVERGQIANAVTLKNLFDQDGALAERGGAQYLFRLADSVLVIENTEDYGRLILDLYQRRQVVAQCEETIADISKVDLERPATAIAAERAVSLSEIAIGAPHLRCIDPRSWQGKPLPERLWIAAQWIPCGVATGLYGPPGYGKTLLLQQLMTASALAGKAWLGLPTRTVRSIGFFCEDDEDELHRRQAAINQAYECDFGDLGAMRIISRLGFENILMTFEDGVGRPTALYHQIIDEAKAFGAELVLIDTVADTFGGNQNDQSHARQFVQFGLAGIARVLGPGASVIASAHPSQTGKTSGSGESGSVQWEAAFRSRFYLDTPKANGSDPDEGDRILTRKKANYASRNETIDLEWHNGVFAPKYKHTGILGSIERGNARQLFLDHLDRMTIEGQPVSSNMKAGNYAPRIFEQRPGSRGFKKPDFEYAMQTLFAAGEIKNQPYGRKGDQRSRIVRAEESAMEKPV
jgi:RecA-family ATPase